MANFVLYELLPVILNMSLTAGVVILCVLLARLCMKKAPKVFSYALWAVVLFRLLCPVSVNAEFSLLGLLRSPAVEATEHTTVIEYVPQTVVVTPPAPQTQTQLPPSAATPTVPSGGVTTIPSAGVVNNAERNDTPQVEEPIAQTGDPAMAVATFAWLGGVAVMAVYSVISYNRLKSRLVGAVRLRENICLADHIGSPFVMGIFRPKIYLPSSLPEQEQQYILLHEQHHIRRGDHLIKALAFVALCIHWFNPLVWLAFVLSGKDMEMSCDEAVVKKLGEEIRSDYSASLLSLATGRRVIAGTPLAFGEGDTKSRIKNMLNWKQAKPAVVFLSAAAVILVLLVCVTNPKADEPANEETQAEQKLAEHDIPKEVSKVLFDFLDAYQNDPEKASSFCHFETEEEKTAFEQAVLINRIVSYEILDADARSEDLYEIKFHLIKESGDIPERSYYVGKHNGQFWVMINIGNVPDSLRVDMQAFLAELHGDDIAEVDWLIDAENKPANTEVATLIRNAMKNGTVSYEPLTDDGYLTVIWWLEIRIADKDTGWDADDILYIRAGLDENVVLIDGGANLPEGPIWVKDEELYRLVRTSMDTPDNTTIDAAAFAAYRDIVDIYLAQVPYASTIVESSRRELLGFYLAAEREDLGAKIYCINTVTIVEPAEKAPYLLAGGAYVDSQLRIHGDGESNLLVVVDDEPVGFVNWMWLELDRGLENCRSKEDLIRAAQNFDGVVQTQQDLPLEPYTGEDVTNPQSQEFTVNGEKYGIYTRTEMPYFVTKSGEKYRLPLPYADADRRYAAMENTHLDSGTKIFSYEAAAAYQVRGHDGAVLTQPGTYYYAVDLNALTYTVRFLAAGGNDSGYAPADMVLPAISALLGDWKLDVAYTETANGITNFGTEIGSAALDIKADRIVSGHIGNLSFQGTWQPDGDTGRYVATVTVTPDDREEKLTFYAFREGAKYLAMDYGNIVLFWTQEAVSEEEPARPGVTVVPDTTPFTDRPIEWTSPLNGMFERTYETQLSMLKNIDRTDPPFLLEETLEFEACAVLLGKSLDTETGESTGTAYILFRDGALGKLPLPEYSNGVEVLPIPESVEKAQWVEQLYYDVLIPSFGYYSYTVDLDSRTVSMMHVAMPTEEDVHAALMAHHPVEIPEGAAYPYSTEGHYVWGYDFSYEEGYPICKLYAYVYFASFEWSNGRPKWIHPSYVMPVEMVFRGGAKDYWALIDFWSISSEDANYESSIRERIPDYFQDWPLGEIDSDILADLNTRVYESAEAYYATLPGLPGPKVFTAADVNFTDRALNFKEKDDMSYSKRLEWVRSGAADSENKAYVSETQYRERGGLLAYICQWVGTPHLGQYVFNLRFADGSTALLPLPKEGYYPAALPDVMEFVDGKFIYERTFTENLLNYDGESVIHLKGTYHYEVDLNAKTVSLTVLPISEEEADLYSQLLVLKNAVDSVLYDYQKDPSQFTDDRAALLDSVTSFWISQKEGAVIVEISGLNPAKTNAFRELFGDSSAYVLTEGHRTTLTSIT